MVGIEVAGRVPLGGAIGVILGVSLQEHTKENTTPRLGEMFSTSWSDRLRATQRHSVAPLPPDVRHGSCSWPASM